ncbi:ATP-binding cassette domain-containing protein [Collinsella stercoris]|uniref:Cobalt ABC transporter, ATP-binding protein n=1 Tax=Collinsella stercoris DSM 13279 TaxID=445975 RepID=B6G9D8_9ACTN|nr:ATP-binding cassette domain-containing protein [Collinsella stercoris]EEA91121.1 cobalt ABC transporter, ATP-binding protein [Collinsella stercoris DSM 13279]UEA46453.1 ATP-binding cassette domain-containing protein [Collinsella stercoris DSM 13279]UWP11028.1 ATP-binding cassette domain-containing protein [Collinsella stercoris]
MLEVVDAGVGYGDVEVLSGASLSVDPGELVALVGDNGCGKSTLGRVMCAAQLVDEGSVVVDGHDPSVSELERLRVRALVGRVCQDPVDQIVSSLVFDEVAFGPRNLGLDDAEVERRVLAALDLVGIPSFADRVTTELSGGQQQRIALAGVLAMHPTYLVLDEPTAQLDSSARAGLRDLFSRLAHESHMGIVLITHDFAEIARADRVIDVARMGVRASDASAGGDRANDAHVGDVRGDEARGSGACVDDALVGAWSTGDASLDSVRSFDACASDARDAGADNASEGGSLGAATCSRVGRADIVHARPVLELDGIYFSYGDRPVLTDVSLRVHAGEVVLLAGASGAGKSTLASIAAGLVAPCSGEVRLWGAPPVPGDVGLAFQQPEAQFFLDTVYDEIAYAPRNLSCDEAEVDRRVHAAVRTVGLDEGLIASSPFELSGGQARRVALASVLSLDAPAYIFDEPSAALDAEGRAFARRMVEDLSREGRAVLVITHDVDEWAPVSSRIVELADGSLHERGRGATGAASFACDGRVSAPGESPRGDGSSHVSSGGTATPLTALGGYTPHAPAARVDARVKLILLLLATVGVFTAQSPVVLSAWAVVLFGALGAARMRPSRILSAMRPVAIVLTFTLIANLVSCDGRATIELAGPVGLDPAGGLRGLLAVVRIALLVGFSLVVAASTTGTQLSDACVRLLRPCARWGVPVGPLGTVLSLALRFIPLVSEELNRIRLAQRARGASFDNGTVIERIGVWASVLTPLMIGLFRRADRLAEAMSARCYDAVSAGRLPAPRPLGSLDRRVLIVGTGLAIALSAVGAFAQLW